MKKAICLMLCIIMLLALCGCNYNNTQEDNKRMTLVYSDFYCSIYRDNETGVYYFGKANGGVCVMVNADGTPYTGEG